MVTKTMLSVLSIVVGKDEWPKIIKTQPVVILFLALCKHYFDRDYLLFPYVRDVE